jgi:hypothetical protein
MLAPHIRHLNGIAYKTLTPDQKSEIIRRYLAGDRDRDIAADYGVSRSTPRQTTVRAGYQPRFRKRFLALREDAFAMITPESAYWVGFLLADGCILIHRQKQYHYPYIRVGLAAEDADHVEKFRRFLAAEKTVEIYSRGTWNGYRRQNIHVLTVGSVKLASDLATLGVAPNKTGKETAHPNLVMNHDFWRGVIDGDGSVFVSSKGDPTISLCNGGAELLRQFSRYVQSMVQAKCTIRVNREGVHTVSISGGRNAPKILAALYKDATVALDRKAAKAHAIFTAAGY